VGGEGRFFVSETARRGRRGQPDEPASHLHIKLWKTANPTRGSCAAGDGAMARNRISNLRRGARSAETCTRSPHDGQDASSLLPSFPSPPLPFAGGGGQRAGLELSLSGPLSPYLVRFGESLRKIISHPKPGRHAPPFLLQQIPKPGKNPVERETGGRLIVPDSAAQRQPFVLERSMLRTRRRGIKEGDWEKKKRL